MVLELKQIVSMGNQIISATDTDRKSYGYTEGKKKSKWELPIETRNQRCLDANMHI
jgi:hypothetical protein